MDSGSSLIYKSKERPVIRFVSGDTVYEECLHDGRYIGLYWSASGQVQRENYVDMMPRNNDDIISYPLHTFSIVLDGQSLHNRWKWIDAYTRSPGRDDVLEAVVELEHAIRDVSLKVITSIDGTSIISRKLEITNTGSRNAVLSDICPMCGLLWENTFKPFNIFTCDIPFDKKKKAQYSLGYIKAQDWGEEGNFVWQPLDSETFKIERVQRKTYGNPYFIVKNEVTGEMFFIAFAWSGGYFAEFKFDCRRDWLTFKIGPCGPAPLRIIGPGETVCSPKVHVGPVHCGMDRAVMEWHRHLRRSVIPEKAPDKKMFTAAGRVVERPGDWILREVDIAAEMGVEAFVVDAGWYGYRFDEKNPVTGWTESLGDWVEAAHLPAGGLSALRERIHQKGMLFGLWMEAEAISVKSRLFIEHPDWRITYDGMDAGTIGNKGVVDLSNEEAAEYVENSVIGAIRDYKLDIFKLDYNMNIYEGGQRSIEGYAENQSWRHFEKLYGIFDRVLKEYPDVVLENCASGGGRNDLGMMSRFHYCAQSDLSVIPFSIRSINALTLFIPPESICYYHNHVHYAHQIADLDTHLRVSLFAIPVFVGFGSQSADRTTNYFDKTREYIKLAKEFCRPIMAGPPNVFHHTPYIGLYSIAQWCVLEYAMQDMTAGYVGLFRIGSDNEEDDYLLRPRGIDGSRDYEVMRHNSRTVYQISGEKLKNEGLMIHLDQVHTSELILYKEIKKG